MHRQRIKQLEPLSGQLNREVFLHLCRSMDYELAAASRDIMEIKEQQEACPPTKVRPLRASDAASTPGQRPLAAICLCCLAAIICPG